MSVVVITVFSFDCDSSGPHRDGGLEFTKGEYSCFTLAEAKSYVRSLGWRFRRDGSVLCPSCAASVVSR